MITGSMWTVCDKCGEGYNCWPDAHICKACIPPQRKDVLTLLNEMEGFSEDDIMRKLMRHYKGHCNPAMLREIIRKDHETTTT